MASRRAKPAFTLVELLVVIGIIALLVTILVPTIQKSLETVQSARTRGIIKNLGFALENFKNDFGFYPPSRPEASGSTNTNAYDPINIGWAPTGALNLFYYLGGPGRSGWGVGGGGRMPYEAQKNPPTGAKPTKTYGPYYEVTEEQIKYDIDSKTGTLMLGGFKDAFKPGGKILYWRYDPNPITTVTPPRNYAVGHNYAPGTPPVWQEATGDPTGVMDYGNQVMFEDVVRASYGVATTSVRWKRSDYLLVSPGPDGRYGWTKQKKADPDAGTYVAASKDDKADDTYNAPVSPDDITNW
jgi:prepilin-type N-terminal cleavage/methylation domain-containing protein